MNPRQSSRPGDQSERTVFLGLLAAVFFFVAVGIVSYLNVRNLRHDSELVAHTHDVLSALDDILSLMKDAETGQRGYVLTGDARYLEPYLVALAKLEERLAELERLVADDPEQQSRIAVLKMRIADKRRELDETITLRREQGFDAAKAVVATDRGKIAMDGLRSLIKTMEESEEGRRAQRIVAREEAFRTAVFSGIITGALGVGLAIAVSFLLRRDMRTRRREEWLSAGQVGLNKAMGGEQRPETLGGNILKFFAEYLDAQVGAIFVKSGAHYRRTATYGVPAENRVPEQFDTTDGILGQAVKDSRIFFVRDIPEGYLTLGSALGQGAPRHLVVAPMAVDGVVNAVLELGFIRTLDDMDTTLLERVDESIAVAIRTANFLVAQQNLLEETQRQAEELQVQQEELRVSNEELEQQGQLLKESQARLELQHTELEQTNANLEEQAATLEMQRNELAAAKSSLEGQARELEQASRYKSDFLANMSHELRTPLNSSLILAKLLADNPNGNLTDEQISYATTIQAAGNDLLTLINDILDLSKIEAGKMEIRPEPTAVSDILSGLVRSFEPMAREKGLTFETRVDPRVAEVIETDRQRLEQVLKNLIANAVKFTESGSVLVRVQESGGRIAFAVVDTGIGIPPNQQELIFEAFRQADGTVSRKYEGTGLGLSISRQLTRLLGGEITLESEPGRGSIFTITIPVHYSNPRPRGREERDVPVAVRKMPESAEAIPPIPSPPSFGLKPLSDDRERLIAGRRLILVVEDDKSFARILSDLARELGFQCLLASTAAEAVALAAQYLPHAVLLDIGLPDHSGLSVLDRLKHDARTRHIPVHVVSAGDYAETALSLGAVGYMLKPVKREALAEALQKLEAKLDQRLRRVLIVEDDAVQRDALQRLLRTEGVEVNGAATAGECLHRLKSETFDCMVLDLSLPDASGYSVLETLSREDAYSFPPVIVYTGRELSSDEEQRLRRYSKSIIIKGAKSPERLLDEVTLFLHQVVSDLPPEQRRMLEKARSRDAVLEGRRILVVEDDVRNIFALTSILEPRGALIEIARNGREAIDVLERSLPAKDRPIDLVLMDVMMPEMDGLTATREIRMRAEWKRLPIIMLTAKAMKDDQERCLDAGANDYMAKPLDVEKLLSLVRVWMPR